MENIGKHTSASKNHEKEQIVCAILFSGENPDYDSTPGPPNNNQSRRQYTNNDDECR